MKELNDSDPIVTGLWFLRAVHAYVDRVHTARGVCKVLATVLLGNTCEKGTSTPYLKGSWVELEQDQSRSTQGRVLSRDALSEQPSIVSPDY